MHPASASLQVILWESSVFRCAGDAPCTHCIAAAYPVPDTFVRPMEMHLITFNTLPLRQSDPNRPFEHTFYSFQRI